MGKKLSATILISSKCLQIDYNSFHKMLTAKVTNNEQNVETIKNIIRIIPLDLDYQH